MLYKMVIKGLTWSSPDPASSMAVDSLCGKDGAEGLEGVAALPRHRAIMAVDQEPFSKLLFTTLRCWLYSPSWSGGRGSESFSKSLYLERGRG